MEIKKGVGDVMNQLGIISDLLERVNLETEEIKVEIVLTNEEFETLHDKVSKKRGLLFLPKKSFNIQVGNIIFTFRRT